MNDRTPSAAMTVVLAALVAALVACNALEDLDALDPSVASHELVVENCNDACAVAEDCFFQTASGMVDFDEYQCIRTCKDASEAAVTCSAETVGQCARFNSECLLYFQPERPDVVPVDESPAVRVGSGG